MYFILTAIYMIGGIIGLGIVLNVVPEIVENTPLKGEGWFVIKFTIFSIIGIVLAIIWPISAAVAGIGFLVADKLSKDQ